MRKQAVAVVIAGFFSIFISFAVRYTYGLLLPYMLPALDITKAQAGVIYSSYFITYLIFSPLLGILVDRYDPKIILTLFIGVLGLGTLMMSFSTSLLSASLFFAMAGLGQSAGWVPVVILVQRWVREERRGTAVAVVDLGSGTGIIVVSLVIPLIVVAFGWRGAWTSLGVFGLLVAVSNFFLVSNPPSAPSVDEIRQMPKANPTFLQAYRIVMGAPAFWLIGVAYALVGFCILIPFAFLTTYATSALSLSYPTAASLIGILAFAGICGKLSLAHISDKIGRPYIMMLCGILNCTGVLGMALARSFIPLLVGTTLFGVGYGATWPVYAAASRDFFNKEFAGRVMGLWTLFLGLGSIISPVLAGWAIDFSGSFFWAFILSGGAAAMSCIILVPLLRMTPVEQY